MTRDETNRWWHQATDETVDLLREQHAEIERLRDALRGIETLKVFADGAPASAYQTEGWMRELAREALEGER